MKVNASRLEELFYQEVGDPIQDTSLMSFLATALRNVKKSKKTTINFKSGDAELSLKFNKKDITEVKISGVSQDYRTLLDHIDGYMNAKFKKLNPEDIGLSLYSSEEKKKSVKVGALRLHLIKGNDGARIYRAELEVPGKKKEMPISELSEDDERTLDILDHATLLEVKDEWYLDDNPKKELLRSKCKIAKKANKWLWSYSVNTIHRDPLPASLFPELVDLFELIMPSFTDIPNTYMKISR